MAKNTTKAARADIAARTASYIVAAIDGTDWEQLLNQHRYCAQCPARAGAHLIEDTVQDLCLACPLRPLMLDLAELTLRRGRAASADTAQGTH